MPMNVPMCARTLQVAVTGVAGYVAQHLVHRLLAAGYTVHGTVRTKASGGEQAWEQHGI